MKGLYAMMEIYEGKSIFDGIAIGEIRYYKKAQSRVVKKKVSDVDFEWNRYEQARNAAIDELVCLYGTAVNEVGKLNADIFEVQMMMLRDDDYNTSVKDMIINRSINAEYAVEVTRDNFSDRFSNMKDEYFKAIAIDVCDISNRIIHILNVTCDDIKLEKPCIIAADYLTPSDVVRMDKSKLLAFVISKGSVNSHTAILARTMGIPALIITDIKQEWDGKLAIVDGNKNKFIVDADEEKLNIYRKEYQEAQNSKILLRYLRGKETVTGAGQRIKIYANIDSTYDIDSVLQNEAEGIGLFRSEFLYLDKDGFPTEEEQFLAYKQAVETMEGKVVIIRTFDIGADKRLEYFDFAKEENPAMGYRGIRICLTRPNIFKAQLRALFRASVYGKTAIMYPMITSLDELHSIKGIVEEVKGELTQSGIIYGEVAQGIMVETPAAAIISDLFTEEVDFLSIGTNDLIQFTLAVDRQNPMLDRYYNSHHEAVLRLVKMVVDNAHKAGITAGICGELGADLELTQEFLKLGVDYISIPPECILPVRQLIRNL